MHRNSPSLTSKLIASRIVRAPKRTLRFEIASAHAPAFTGRPALTVLRNGCTWALPGASRSLLFDLGAFLFYELVHI